MNEIYEKIMDNVEYVKLSVILLNVINQLSKVEGFSKFYYLMRRQDNPFDVDNIVSNISADI